MTKPPSPNQARRAAQRASGLPPVEWEGEPLPIDRRGEPPPFPVEVLPKRIGAMVRATAVALQVPADLPGMLALAVLSTAAGGRAVVEVDSGWREVSNIYVAPVMPSGSRKSPTYAAMTEPIRRAEAQLRADARGARAEALAMAEVRAMQADKARRSAAGAEEEKRDEALAEAIAATEAALSAQVPPEPELMADDVTSESLVTILDEQGGRVALLAPEGDVLMTIAGRYNGKPNPGVLLRGWCGESIRVRRGNRREDLPHVYLTLGICLQPEMLREIAEVPGFRGRGVLARHLFAVPPDTVGYRKPGSPAAKAEIQDAYISDMQALILSLHGWTDPYVLTLTDAARKVFREWEEAIEPRLRRAGGDLGEELREWGSKIVGTTARLAGLLHLGARARGKWGEPIGEDTIKDAITLAEYLIQHARIAFGDMVPNPAAESALAVLDWITAAVRDPGRAAAAQGRVTRREIHSGCRTRTRFRLSADLTPPLALLTAHGYIQLVRVPGTRSEVYAVHPSLLQQEGAR